MIFDKQLISFFLTLLLTYTSFSQNNFIKNDGQLPKKDFSKANFSQGAFFVETGGFTYNLLDKKKLRDRNLIINYDLNKRYFACLM